MESKIEIEDTESKENIAEGTDEVTTEEVTTEEVTTEEVTTEEVTTEEVTTEEVTTEEVITINEIDPEKNVVLKEEEIETKSKSQLIKVAGELRDRRNELNQEASRRAKLRDRLNAETRGRVDKAHSHRQERDQLNDLVQTKKDVRNKINQDASDLFKVLDNQNKSKSPQKEKSIEELKKEIEGLEFKQQTEVLTVGTERKLIEKIGGLKDKYTTQKKKIEDNRVSNEKKKEAENARGEASKLHKEMIQLADDAQAEHNTMIECYRDADLVRNEADEIHTKFIEAQEMADAHHEMFIKVQKVLRKVDKKDESSRHSAREAEREEAKREGQEIYERFKQGQSLDTEDLMKLQKAGLL
jgi:uncharacterized coiled-coil DUF342 family protein